MAKSLAIKYRPTTFKDVVEQDIVADILQYQLKTNTIKNCYLFCGGAGTGKTTCARIFANELNKGKGHIVEIDAASNNSVDDVREIIKQARTKPIDSEYKVFIIDECHSLSNTAWQAMLKLIEEPPAQSIFIFCTTDPQKIPKTILSRVQRYDFKRISQEGIISRLKTIINEETTNNRKIEYRNNAINYIAKVADGGMRDAITMLDKCLSYSTDLCIDNVVKALGVAQYDTMIKLLESIIDKDKEKVILIIETLHSEGKDLKQFISQFLNFVLDVNKYDITKSFEFIQIPENGVYKEFLDRISSKCQQLLEVLIKLDLDIKWNTSPKYQIEAVLLKECF